MTSTPTSPPPGTGATSDKKRRAANLLRDYYGLSSPGAPPASTTTTPAVPPDPTDPDNPAFSKAASLDALLASNTLSQLLAKESQLLTEIRQLDGERQSLVYNHHHELVAASDTIRNMKVKSESLDPSLDSLRASFSTMSQLSSELDVLRSCKPASQEQEQAQLDPLKDLQPVVMLPTTLRDLIDDERPGQGLPQAERLWGQMEGVLAAWSDAGVAGVKEIMAECRVVLKEARKAAGSNNLSSS